MSEPQKIPTQLQSSINYRVLLIILGLVVGFQLYINSIQDPDEADYIISVISILNPLAASITAFYVARKYRDSKVFGRAYLALGLGLTMFALGEISYGALNMMGAETYPSIADVFFFLFYPLGLYHLITNIRFFKPKLSIATKSIIVTVPLSIVGIYSYLSFNEIGEANFDYYYGLIFIISSSVVFSAGILGARIFRQGVLGIAWLVLVIGIVLTTIGDIWYYYLETFDQYDLTHPMNLFWYASYMVIAYALYKHQNLI
jgi:hypothetical protein